MKKLRNISLLVFLLGLIFIFRHYPGAALLIIAGTLMLLMHGILFFIKNSKKDLRKAFVILSISLWTVYFAFRILYLPGGPIFLGLKTIFIIPLLSTIVTFILISMNIRNVKLIETFLIAYFIFSFWLGYVHSDRIYYFFNLNELMYENSRQERFQTWDRYSWYLYLVDKEKEALEANDKAQRIIEEKLKTDQSYHLTNHLEVIKKHRELILSKKWSRE